MQVHKDRQHIWQYFQQHRMASIIVGHVSVIMVLSSVLGTMALFGAFAQTSCAKGNQSYLVQGGDTLGGIAVGHNTTWQALAQYNGLANPNMIYVNQTICIPSGNGSGTVPTSGTCGFNVLSLIGQSSFEGSQANVANKICSVFGSGTGGQNAVRIAECESTLGQNLKGPYQGGGEVIGVFQILYHSTWDETPYTSGSPFDALTNIKAAQWLVQRDGRWSQEWECAVNLGIY